MISKYGSMQHISTEICLNSSINHRAEVLRRENDKRLVVYFINKVLTHSLTYSLTHLTTY